MRKKLFLFSLLSFALASFFLVILQYQVTRLSLQVPELEESCARLKEETTLLNFKIRALKSPKRLIAEKEKMDLAKLHFPHSAQVVAIYLQPETFSDTQEKSTALSLPLAQIFAK